MQLRTLLVSLSLPTLALAQTAPAYISPKIAATGLGNSNNNIPFSWTPTGYQQVHSKSSFNNQSPAPFTTMRMRMGNGFTNFAGKTIDVELFHASSPNDAASASSLFASNVVTGTEVNTLVRKQVNLPTVPNNDWVIAFPFDNLYVWPATHLSWRANVYGNSNGNAIFTYPLDAWWNIGSYSTIGTGCIATGGSKAATLTATIWSPGVQSTFTANSQTTVSGPALLTLGGSTTTWGSIPLPFSLTALNAPGCSVYNDIAASLAGVTNASGTAAFQLLIPNNPALEGAVFYTQGIFIDASFNGLGLITSNSTSNKIGASPNVSRIYAIGSPGGTGGTLGTHFGMAVGFN